MYKYNKRNRPATRLIKEYSEHIKGKTRSARAELHKRFAFLDYCQQKKILLAHLKSSMSDRQWAYSRLLDYWDDSFIEPVLQVWEEFHEPRCSWAIAQYFPKDYVYSHFDELSLIDRNYYHLCIRFGNDNDFVIDKGRLQPIDYLSVAYRIGLVIPDKEAAFCFYSIACTACNDYVYLHDLILDYKIRRSINLLKLPKLSRAKFYISKMNLETVENEIEEWLSYVSKEIEKDKKWDNFKQLEFVNEELAAADKIISSIITQNIPTEYKSKIADEIESNHEDVLSQAPKNGINNSSDAIQIDFESVDNPALKELIDKFDLEPF